MPTLRNDKAGQSMAAVIGLTDGQQWANINIQSNQILKMIYTIFI